MQESSSNADDLAVSYLDSSPAAEWWWILSVSRSADFQRRLSRAQLEPLAAHHHRLARRQSGVWILHGSVREQVVTWCRTIAAINSIMMLIMWMLAISYSYWLIHNLCGCSFVRDGVLHIRPTLTAERFGDDFLYNGTLDLRSKGCNIPWLNKFQLNGCVAYAFIFSYFVPIDTSITFIWWHRTAGEEIIHPIQSGQESVASNPFHLPMAQRKLKQNCRESIGYGQVSKTNKKSSKTGGISMYNCVITFAITFIAISIW